MVEGGELHLVKPEETTQLALVFQGVVTMHNGSPAKRTPSKRCAATQSTLASTMDTSVAGVGANSLTPSSKRVAGALSKCTAFFCQPEDSSDIIQQFMVTRCYILKCRRLVHECFGNTVSPSMAGSEHLCCIHTVSSAACQTSRFQAESIRIVSTTIRSPINPPPSTRPGILKLCRTAGAQSRTPSARTSRMWCLVLGTRKARSMQSTLLVHYYKLAAPGEVRANPFKVKANPV